MTWNLRQLAQKDIFNWMFAFFKILRIHMLFLKHGWLISTVQTLQTTWMQQTCRDQRMREQSRRGTSPKTARFRFKDYIVDDGRKNWTAHTSLSCATWHWINYALYRKHNIVNVKDNWGTDSALNGQLSYATPANTTARSYTCNVMVCSDEMWGKFLPAWVWAHDHRAPFIHYSDLHKYRSRHSAQIYSHLCMQSQRAKQCFTHTFSAVSRAPLFQSGLWRANTLHCKLANSRQWSFPSWWCNLST